VRGPRETGAPFFGRWLRRSLRRNLAAGAVATASLALSSALVFCLVAVSGGVEGQLGKELAAYGANLLVLPESAPLRFGLGALELGPVEEERHLAEADALRLPSAGIGVETVTVSSPFLLRIVKTRYPGLKVRISVFGGVDRVRKARMWEEMGADGIVLDSLLVNREFLALARIREAVKCDLELLVNNNCLSSCALSPAHMNALAHAGQSWHGNRGFFIDWCFLRCTEMKLRDPVNYVRSEWIRPEDLPLYEAMGYDLFKVTERDLPTPVMVNRVRAYAARRYDGNLLDLVQPYALPGGNGNERYYRKGIGWALRFLFRPGLVNPGRMLLLKRLADLRYMTRPVTGAPPVVVDNRALDGFMERFREKGCRDVECETCRWCHDFAAKAVRVDPEARRRALEAEPSPAGSTSRGLAASSATPTVPSRR